MAPKERQSEENECMKVPKRYWGVVQSYNPI